jgi:hypothetical protein
LIRLYSTAPAPKQTHNFEDFPNTFTLKFLPLILHRFKYDIVFHMDLNAVNSMKCCSPKTEHFC